METVFPLRKMFGKYICGASEICGNSILYNNESGPNGCEPFPKLIEEVRLKGGKEGFIRCDNYKLNGHKPKKCKIEEFVSEKEESYLKALC